MKKIFAVLLCFCIVISSASFVFGDEDTQKIADLIVSLKEKLSINDDEYEFDEYYQDSYSEKDSYSFSWKKKDDNSKRIRVSADESGKISYFYKTHSYDYSSKFAKISKDEAKIYALNFLEKIEGPKEFGEPEITKSANTYDLFFERVKNGIEVDSNFINITVSSENGEIINYNLSWNDNVEFDEETYISQEKANEIYKNKLGYELCYNVITKDNERIAKVIYNPKFTELLYIDALSGEIKTHKELYAMRENNKFMAEETASEDYYPSELSDEEIKLLNEIEGIVDVEKAVEEVKKIKELEIDNKFVIEGYDIYKRDNGKYVVSAYLCDNKEEPTKYISLSLDGINGKILSYYSYSYEKDEKENNVITNEEGRKKAENFIKNYYKEEYESLVPYETFYESEGIYRYSRKVNGLKVLNNEICVETDLKTGKIESISYKWDDIEFPSYSEVAPIENLYEKLIKDDFIKIVYLLTPKDEKNDLKATAIYKAFYQPSFDAFSLNEISLYEGEPVERTERPEYIDISGHYAEEKIKRLLEEDIYLEGNELEPDKAITYKEFVSLLYMSTPGIEPRPLNELYKSSVSHFNLKINEEKENAPITRLDAIKMLLDIMGFEEFANIKGIFNCPFTDIDEEDEGYGAIAAGLNIVSTADTLFYKDNPLKRADAFIIIYNYMSR